jgi:dephospho-CoA kinase
VYAEIVKHFGPSVVRADKSLDRAALARIAFGGGRDGNGRIEELEAIVHPATIARQAEFIAEEAVRDPDAVVVVESALIFETKFGGESGWHGRFDKIIFVKATAELQVKRFVERTSGGKALSEEGRAAAEVDARRRLAKQAETERNAARCDYVLQNDGPLEQLRVQVEALWPGLKEAAKRRV